MKNALTIIKYDHRRIEELFEQYKPLEQDADNTRLVVAADIITALNEHTQMEEAFLYPLMKAKLDTEERRLVDDACADHGVVKEIVAEIALLPPEDPQFDAHMHVLQDIVTLHIQEEEQELLPRAKEALTEEELEGAALLMKEFKSVYESE